MQQIPNNKSRIEELEKRLYSKENHTGLSGRHDLHQKEYDLKKKWGGDVHVDNQSDLNAIPKPKKSIFGYILIVAIMFFVASAGYTGYVYWKGNQISSADNVDIKILSPISVGGGERLSLDLMIQNNNQIDLETVDLIVEYPVGTKNADDVSQDQGRIRENIGLIPSGGVAKKTIDAVMFGEEGETKRIIFTLEYRIKDSSAIFEKTKEFEIALNAAPVRLRVAAIDEISSGQEMTLVYEIESNNIDELKNVLVRAEYPFGFKFKSSDMEPFEDNNLWLFETLEPKEKVKVEIKGTMEGQNEEERIFKFESGVARNDSPNEIQAVLSSYSHEVKIKRAFVDLQIEINGNRSKEMALRSDESVLANVNFTNNTNDIVNNLILELSLNGAVIDEQTVYVENGVYDSVANKMRWTSQTDPDLTQVEPRKTKTVRFQFNAFPIGTGSKTFINPEIKIDAVVNGKRLAQDNSENVIDSKSSQIIRIVTDTPILLGTQHTSGPIVNTGNIPPKAEQETTYTLAFSVSNSSSNISNAEIVGKLPPYVSWKEVVMPVGRTVTFDPGTRTVRWNIGDVKQGIGYGVEPIKAYFQVGLTPSLNQVGTKPELLNEIYFKANDPFAKAQINKRLETLTTYMAERGNVGDGHENVVK